MATIEFSVPYWGNLELRTTTDTCDYISRAQRHANEKNTAQFSRLQTTANLLLAVAMTFFHAFPTAVKALGESGIYYFSDETKAAKEALYDYGTSALKHLGFSVYQLFLTLYALGFPGEVGERLTLQKPVTLRPGLLSDDPAHITNQLMFQNEGLRRQVTFLESQVSGGSAETAITGLLERNLEYEARMGEVRLLADQRVEYAEMQAKERGQTIEEKDRLLEHQKAHYEHQIKELEAERKSEEEFWRYIEENLESSWKDLTGERLLKNLKHVREKPQIIRSYFALKNRGSSV